MGVENEVGEWDSVCLVLLIRIWWVGVYLWDVRFRVL